MKAHYRESTLGDVVFVAENLREADRREIEAHGHTSTLPPLLEGYRLSHPCQTMVGRDGQPFGLFGAIPDPSEPIRAAVWMMATPQLEQEALAFARGSLRIVNEWNRQYPLLFNFVDSRNEVHIKWLKWLGFVFIRAIKINNTPFYEFVKVNPNV